MLLAGSATDVKQKRVSLPPPQEKNQKNKLFFKGCPYGGFSF